MMPTQARRRRARSALALVIAGFCLVQIAPGWALIVGSPPAGAQAAAGEQRYRPPIDAPVTDPFRPPAVPWGAGNRGLEYGTEAGTVVRAIGPGVISFAGPVAGTLHVTVTHPDGLRSSYSGVAAIRTSVGEVVTGGDVVAVAGTTFHLGVREGERYIDPSGLWGLVVASGPVVLVPVDDPPAAPTPAPTYRSAPTYRDVARKVALRVLARLGVGPWVG